MKSRKAVLNYTTTISIHKTLSEIQEILTENGASAIMVENDTNRIPVGLSFRIRTEFGVMNFQMPARVDRIEALLMKARIATKLRTKEQAARVAWRIIKDGLEAQMAWVQAGMVAMDEVFLAYAQNSQGVPLYEDLVTRRMHGLALPENRAS